jgi:hypothetical protein
MKLNEHCHDLQMTNSIRSEKRCRFQKLVGTK